MVLLRGKRVCEPPDYRWSLLLMDTRDFGGVNSMLPTSWVGIYIRNRISDRRRSGLHERRYSRDRVFESVKIKPSNSAAARKWSSWTGETAFLQNPDVK
ncbi:hypothetical protein EVAR_34348_1 [Eumeta japonica]|uniref:Uncharacterized protein n=1 Tax=Eumeta variegata TaxID=151549 RepID=A0A4C1VCM3_EUMVA|nr:hypothetical protein EVAR_34348_1 [Eumeta japonica]